MQFQSLEKVHIPNVGPSKLESEIEYNSCFILAKYILEEAEQSNIYF